MTERIPRILWALASFVLAISVVATLTFVVATIGVRIPYWGEAEVLFEASRLRRGAPLFVDPLVGAHDLGEPPSRWYVVYPPLWSWVVARFPESSALVLGRVACVLAWFGSLFTIARRARDGAKQNAYAAALFIAGTWIIVNFASTARPDSIACALAAFGLARAVRLGKIDALSAVALSLTPFVKPTLLGLPVGALAFDAWQRRRSALPTIAIAIATAVVVGLGLHVASGGRIFVDVTRSNAQPFSLAVWLEQVPGRLPMFGPVIVLAGHLAWRDRARAGSIIGLGALATSVVWTLVALAKTGSSANYWMEPCIAALVVIAHAPSTDTFTFGRSGSLHAVLALATLLYAGVASVRASIGHTIEYRQDAAFVAEVRERCHARPNDVIAADEAGIELVTNGRILTPTYQTVYLALANMYPVDTWIADLESERVGCLVEHTGQLRLVPALSRMLDARFELVVEANGFRLFVPRSRQR